MEALSAANDRELEVWKLFAILDLESASFDSFDIFEVPATLFSIGGGGIVGSAVSERGGRPLSWS